MNLHTFLLVLFMLEPYRVPLEIIEIQSGSYLGEDDIVRFEDRYGRVESENQFSLSIRALFGIPIISKQACSRLHIKVSNG